MSPTPRVDPMDVLPRHPFRHQDALDLGLSHGQLRQLLLEGRVRRILTDAYCPHDIEDTVGLRLAALKLVVPPHACIVDRTAAWVWGVDLRRPEELTTLPRLDVFVEPGKKRMCRREAGGGSRELHPSDVVEVDGVRVTTPVRTALDLACRLTAYEALAALDALAREQGLTRHDLESLLPRYRGRRGVVKARRLVPLVDPRAESAGESFTRMAIIDAGLPAPEPQVWVRDGAVPLYRLDLAYPRHKVCVEYDGRQHHSSEQDRERDRARRAWLRRHGWIVIVVDRSSFAGDALDDWIRQLRQALEVRAPVHRTAWR